MFQNVLGVLNRAALRLLFVLLFVAAVAVMIASIYGTLWYDHGRWYIVLPAGLALVIPAARSDYKAEMKRPAYGRRWGAFAFLSLLALVIGASIAFRIPPLLEAGHIVTALFTFAYVSFELASGARRFLRNPTWTKMGNMLLS